MGRALSASTFGLPNITSRYDPAATRGFGARGKNYEISTSVQHELMPRVGFTAAYFHRWFDNLLVSQNQTVGLAEPPSSSPQTNVTSVPGSACSASTTASVSILPSLAL